MVTYNTKSYFIHESWPSDGFVDISQLRAGSLDDAQFSLVHRNVIVPCHDAFIEYELEGKTGILLSRRTTFPLRGFWWTFGGKRTRGLDPEESLRRRIRTESGLELENLIYLGWADTIMDADPLGHDHGTHTTDLQYFAKGVGELKTDRTHSEVRVVTPYEYLGGFRGTLHPRLTDFMDLIPGYQP